MFKSLMQPIQLFLQGATGKDRHQKQQLSQQLTRLQVAYECLQSSCDTLQQEHDTLQRKVNQLQKKYSQLQHDRNELNVLFNYADQENQTLDAATSEMRSHIQMLEADNATLQSRVIYLEHKLGLRAYSCETELTATESDQSTAAGQWSANAPMASANFREGVKNNVKNNVKAGLKNGLEDSLDANLEASHTASLEHAAIALPTGDLSSLDLSHVDLSDISLALVGGHEATHREVTEELKKYGLKRCIHIPPHSRESNSRHQIRDKISNCDLVVTITSYIDHSVSNCVKQLKEAEVLTGEVIKVHCHGKSGVVREVLQYFAT